MANCSKLVGQLWKNDVCLTQCYKMVQKEDVLSMIAENVKVHIGPRLLPDNPVSERALRKRCAIEIAIPSVCLSVYNAREL